MLTQRLNEVVTSLTALVEDAQKAERGNKAAARRVRVAVQEAKKSLQGVREASFELTGEEKSEAAEG